MPAGGAAGEAITTAIPFPDGVSLDAAGNLYVLSSAVCTGDLKPWLHGLVDGPDFPGGAAPPGP